MNKMPQQVGKLLKIQKQELTVFEFPNIAALPGVRHGIFSREGGYSRGAYSSLNVSFGVGDSEEAVVNNRKRVSGYFKDGQLFFARQVHGKEVCMVHHSPGCGDKTYFCDAGTGDAMVTNVPGISLAIQIADCQAVMIYDPAKHVVANVHAGWRGNIQNIIGRTLKIMKEQFNSVPADVRVGISPSLGPCCAEFVNYQKEFPENLWRYKDVAHHFDLWALSHDQLCQEGVLTENISISGLCTRCNSDIFFSYRAQKETGRFAAVIGLT
jgi:YfiH family protein